MKYCTTNQQPNSVIRKAVKKRKLFPSDDPARKVVYPAIMDAPKKRTMPIRNWKGEYDWVSNLLFLL